MWRVEFSAAAEQDFELIFDHLTQSCQSLGDPPNEVFDRAGHRINEIQAAALGLADIPFQGTLRAEILPGLRFVRRTKAVFWFIPDEADKVVQVLAVFFGGQDHIRHMLTRLLESRNRQCPADGYFITSMKQSRHIDSAFSLDIQPSRLKLITCI